MVCMARAYDLVIDTGAATGVVFAARFDRQVLSPLRVVFADAIPGCDVILTIEQRGEDWPVLVGLELEANDPSATNPITSGALRQVRIAELIQLATRQALHVGTDTALASVHTRASLFSHDEIVNHEYRDEDYLPDQVVSRGDELRPTADWLTRAKAGGITGPRTLRSVAALYRQAIEYGVAPNPWVQRWLDVSSSTASYWIRCARREGLLPPSTRKPRSDRKSDA